MQRYLIIGVGGSGGNTVRQTVRELERRLRATRWTEGLPTAWKFLHIDVRQNADDLQGDIPVSLRSSDTHLGLGTWPYEYGHYDEILRKNPALLKATARWRPDPSASYNSPHEGAGQRRAVGRVITMTQLGQISAVLDSTMAAMFNSEANAQMDRLAAHLHADALAIKDPAPARAIIISSISGGAGSGAFLDLVQLLKARATVGNEWLVNPLSILFAADIFQTLGVEQGKGIEPNTLAALSELMAAYGHQGSLSPNEAIVTQLGGGAQPLKGNLGPKYTLIVGRRNADLDLATPGAVYGATGKAIAAFIGSPKVQQDFDTYLIGNWNGPAMMLRTGSGETVHAASSFGYGNVTLARGLLSRYAAERIAARALNRLTRGHLEEEKGSFTREELVKKGRADEREASFFGASGLWEVTKDHNQVLDALRDENTKKLALDDVKKRVLDKIRDVSPDPQSTRRGRKQKGIELSRDQWCKSFGDSFDAEAKKFVAEQEDVVNTRARAWAVSIQGKLVAATQHEIALGGVPLALELLDRLSSQVGQAVTELEKADSQFREQHEPSFLAAANEAFNRVVDRTIGPSHPAFEEAATNRRTALSRRTEAHLYALAADMLRDLNERCIPQLRQAVAALLNTVIADLKSPATRTQVDQWSVAAVGRHLQPAPNEVLLEPIEAYPELLDNLLVATMNVDGSKNALSAAVAEVIEGAWPSDDNPDPQAVQDALIDSPGRWAPRRSEARKENQPSSVGAFETSVVPLAILDRAQDWVQRRSGLLSTTVNESLQSWLNPSNPEDAAGRADTFVQSFGRALKHAAPMISINPAALTAAHGVSHFGQHPVISPIPLGVGHRARGPVVELLKSVPIEEALIADFFDPNFSGDEVEIISFLDGCLHPIVFDSIFAPIGQDWLAKRNDPYLRREWWSWRRARPLASFMPVSSDHQTALVRGWLTATILGQVPMLTRPWSQQPLNVWSPEGRRSFPPVLFTEVADPRLVFAALCEALPLAMVSFANGNPGELKAYERLIDLGTRGEYAAVGGYPIINQELADWLQSGKTRSPQPTFEAAPLPSATVAGPADGTMAQRATAILDLLTRSSALIEEIAQTPVTAETSLTVDPRWELCELYREAISQLSLAVREFAESQTVIVVDQSTVS